MKKSFTLLFVSFIFTFLFYSIPARAETNWNQYFHWPCEVGVEPWAPISDTSWYGPYEYNLCMDSLQNIDIGCPNSTGCCFKIIYYDYTHHHKLVNGQIVADHYAVYIAAILMTNGSGCENCDKIKIADLFYQKLIECKFYPGCYLYDPDFLNLDSVEYKPGSYDVWMITKGHCRNIQNYDSICSDNCCWSKYYVHINRSGYYDGFEKYQESKPLSDTCYSNPQTCTWYCNEFPFEEWLESCCDSIQVSHTIIPDSCCVNISVYNPYCWAPAPKAVFQKFNTLNGQYETEQSINCPYGSTVNYTMCPANGNHFVKYRVKIVSEKNPDIPDCGTTFEEGKTMYTDSVDLSTCCRCDSASAGWLTVLVANDTTCGTGCKVHFELNIDSSVTCFKYYVVEDEHGTKGMPPKNIETEPISNSSFCLDKGEYGTVKVYLLQHLGENLDSACIITKGVACDTANECCPENHNDWLTTSVVYDTTFSDTCCRVIMNLQIPDSITCFHYYYVQDINNNYLTGYNNLETQPIDSVRYCLGTGESGFLKVTLVNNYENMDTTCIINKDVNCPFYYMPLCSLTCDEPWHSVDSTDIIQIDIGCTMKVYYTYRTACPDAPLGNWQELFILYIDYNGCGNYSSQQLFQKAFEYLVQRDPMGFSPMPGDTGCSETWKIGVVSCWRIMMINEGSPLCSDSACCEQILKVCRDSNNVVTYETVKPWLTWDSLTCEPLPDSGYIDPNKCYSICAWLANLYGLVGPQQGIIEPSLNVIDSLTESTQFIVQNKNGILNISLKSKCGEKLRIDVTDVYGINWVSYEQLSITGEMNFKIDLHKLDRGFYVFKVYCNNNYIGNSKIIVE